VLYTKQWRFNDGTITEKLSLQLIFLPRMKLSLMLLFITHALAAKRRVSKVITVDDFSSTQTNSLGGDISYASMNHVLTTIPSVKLEPTSSDARYTTQLSRSGCFDASEHDALRIEFVVRHEKHSKFDVLVEYFDETCTVSGGQLLVSGPDTIKAMRTSTIDIPKSQYDKNEEGGDMATRLKSISLVNFSFNETQQMLVFLQTMNFIPKTAEEYAHNRYSAEQ